MPHISHVARERQRWGRDREEREGGERGREGGRGRDINGQKSRTRRGGPEGKQWDIY